MSENSESEWQDLQDQKNALLAFKHHCQLVASGAEEYDAECDYDGDGRISPHDIHYIENEIAKIASQQRELVGKKEAPSWLIIVAVLFILGLVMFAWKRK